MDDETSLLLAKRTVPSSVTKILVDEPVIRPAAAVGLLLEGALDLVVDLLVDLSIDLLLDLVL